MTRYILPAKKARDGVLRIVTDSDVFWFINAKGEAETFGKGDFNNTAKVAEAGLVMLTVLEQPVHDASLYHLEESLDVPAAAMGWTVVPNHTAAQYRTVLYDRIKARRKSYEEDGFVHAGVFYDTDIKGSIRLSDTARFFAALPDGVLDWQARDPITREDLWVQLTAEGYQAVVSAGLAFIQACFVRQKALTEELAQVEDDLEALAAWAPTIETGWPE